MSIYYLFPKEIWTEIILELPCLFIYDLMKVNKQLYTLCKSLIDIRKMKGFPRQKCVNHHIISQYPKLIKRMGNIKRNDVENYQILATEILRQMYKDNVNLIAGDIINYNNLGCYIFDGIKIIDLDVHEFPYYLNPINNLLNNYWDIKFDIIKIKLNLIENQLKSLLKK